jgi:hypothetical protein
LTVPWALDTGSSPAELARQIGTTKKVVERVAAAADPVSAVLKATLQEAATKAWMGKAALGLGRMLLGTLSERAFEDFWSRSMAGTDLHLVDTREKGTDTDYHVFNGSNKPAFRLNIKFYGSIFRDAKNLVGLETDDCFALATYKIHHAMQKQDEEFIPYIFVTIGVPGLSGESVGTALPSDLVHFAALTLSADIGGKRAVEDAVVRHLVTDPQPPEVEENIRALDVRIRAARWRVVSARRANTLLGDLLFDRVYALRVRGFTKSYRGAEVDMHFSVSRELTPLDDLFTLLRDHGLHGLTARLERGEL